MILWKNNQLKTIEDSSLQWIHDMRQVGENEVEILTDPWSDNSAIWLFNIIRESKIKIREFKDYKSKEYTEDVKW